MTSRVTWLTSGICAVLVSVPLAVGPQARYISGAVHDGNDQGVARTEVRIEGAGSDVTTDSGEFKIPLLPPLKVGRVATFRVVGWVIIDPCYLIRGRTVLPDPDEEPPIPLQVLRPGDRRLLAGRSIGCLLEQDAAQLKAKPASVGSPRSSLQGEQMPVFAKLEKPSVLGLGAGSPGDVRIIAAAYRPKLVSKAFEPSSQESQAKAQAEVDAFLASQAKELGFTAEQLAAAIDQWAKSTEDLYQKGLAALHELRYSEATRLISESIPSPSGRLVERYVPLASAEYEQGHYPAAESALRKVLAVDSDDPLVLNNLGIVLEAEAKYTEAEPLYRRALATNEKALGPEHPDVATDLNNLAALYAEQGEYAEAEPLYKRALAIAEKALGPEHLDVAKDLNNLAALYTERGEYAEAEPLYKRALAIAEKALGPEHPDVATDLNNLALLYHNQGKYAEAEPLYKRALAIDEEALGPEHPHVATNLNNLAALYKEQGEYAEAEPLYKRALAIDEKALGPEHPGMARDLNNLAALYDDQGKYTEAEPLYRRALATDEKALGPEHPTLATNLNNLAELYWEQGKYAEAEPLYRRALAIDEKALGPEHPHVATEQPGEALRRPTQIHGGGAAIEGRWRLTRKHWGPSTRTWRKTSTIWR
ncbi:MAG TPA: tetratricopeptide repeat protein [Terriglobia bacterium]|nr:tetratricopeptide repeat protein [Terriglobia bacterium]